MLNFYLSPTEVGINVNWKRSRFLHTILVCTSSVGFCARICLKLCWQRTGLLLHTPIPPWLHPALSWSIYILQNHPSANVLVSTRTLTLLICKFFSPWISLPVQFWYEYSWWRHREETHCWSGGLPPLTSRINVKWPSAFAASGHINAQESGRYENKFY